MVRYICRIIQLDQPGNLPVISAFFVVIEISRYIKNLSFFELNLQLKLIWVY